MESRGATVLFEGADVPVIVPGPVKRVTIKERRAVWCLMIQVRWASGLWPPQAIRAHVMRWRTRLIATRRPWGALTHRHFFARHTVALGVVQFGRGDLMYSWRSDYRAAGPCLDYVAAHEVAHLAAYEPFGSHSGGK